MASRPPSPTKKSHKPERLRFETRLRLYNALLCLPILALLTALLLIEHFSTTAIISILVIVGLALLLAVAAFMDQIIRPLQTLANVVAALREEDYSFRARGAHTNDPFGDLAIEINALADMHQTQRLGALEAAALFRRVIAELDAPVLAFDQSAHLRLINPAAERLFKINAARDLGRTAAELNIDMLIGHTGEEVIQIPDRSQPPGQMSDKLVQTHSRWMLHATQFRQRGVPHTLMLLTDVSTALREEERIAWRRLIRVLGHEISNSLAPIKSIAGTLRARLPQTHDQTHDQSMNGSLPDFDRGLGVIESRAESLNRFVQAYRQLAQLPAPSLRRVPVRPLLERVVSCEQRLEVELKSIPELEILADLDQIEQLLINLVRNGVEAAFSAREESIVRATAARTAPAGKVALAPSVSIHAEPRAGFLSITISDNGPGLTNPGNLFVPFYTTKKSGSGVGLVLARQIAEAHGGTLELRNRTNTHGCDATVRLPLAPDKA